MKDIKTVSQSKQPVLSATTKKLTPTPMYAWRRGILVRWENYIIWQTGHSNRFLFGLTWKRVMFVSTKSVWFWLRPGYFLIGLTSAQSVFWSNGEEK